MATKVQNSIHLQWPSYKKNIKQLGGLQYRPVVESLSRLNPHRDSQSILARIENLVELQVFGDENENQKSNELVS